MIETTDRWFEIVHYNDKQESTIAKLVHKMWLCRYPCPAIITYNHRKKFLCHAFKKYLIRNEFKIRANCAIAENAQANSILEIIHQVIANLVRTFDFKKNLDEGDPWEGILAATSFAI